MMEFNEHKNLRYVTNIFHIMENCLQINVNVLFIFPKKYLVKVLKFFVKNR